MPPERCEFWRRDTPCGQPVVERLVFLNPLIHCHVHADGSLLTCAEHLAEHRADALFGGPDAATDWGDGPDAGSVPDQSGGPDA